MAELTQKQIQDSLALIIEYFGGIPDDGNKVQFWAELAERLSRIVGKEPAWTWRYPQGVYVGTTAPSKLFTSSVMALGAALDEVPLVLSYTIAVKVFARPGAVDEGSLILGESKPCARPGCRVRIVPNVPWRKYCSDECYKLAHEKEKSNA